MLPSPLTPDMDKLSHGVMKAIVGKALTKRYVPYQGSKRTPQKSLSDCQSDKDLRHTQYLTLERSAPIDIPGRQKLPGASTVKAKTTRTTPEIELEIPFPQFLNMSSHHAHPHSNMDHRSLPEKPPTPPFLTPFTHKSRKELQEEKYAEAMEMLKRRAVRQWKIERTKSFPPPRFTPPAGYSYGPEDFELADDFDRIIFLPLEEELLTGYWSDDITFRVASARGDTPTRQDIGSSTHRPLFRVKADGDLAAWKTSKQKHIQWAHDLEKPKRPEPHVSQELKPNACDSGAQPSGPKGLHLHISEVGESSSVAAAAPQTPHRLEASTEKPREFAEMDYYSSDESYEGSEWTDDDSEYYDDPSADLFISTAEPPQSSDKGKARCVDV